MSVSLCTVCQTPLPVADEPCPACGNTPHGSEAAATQGPLDERTLALLEAQLRTSVASEFEILGLLGQGGMAAVFTARDLALSRLVALKVMSPSLMMHRGMVERFHTEAVTQANLTHPNIVSVYAVRRAGDLMFFTMQLIQGRSLQRALAAERHAGRAIAFDVAGAILAQVGSALSYAHIRGLVHRDIKPANVLLSATGDAVVTDFGIAKVIAGPSLTMTGTLVGTAQYMSPEQCYGSELTGASDQYSLGVMAYELIVGAPPFRGPSFAVMQAHTTQPVPPIRDVRPDCPFDLEDAILRMLAKRPEARFPTIDDALMAMAAHPVPLSAQHPVRRELIRLAAVTDGGQAIANVLAAPASPIPRAPSHPGRSPMSSGSEAISAIPEIVIPDRPPGPTTAGPEAGAASSAPPVVRSSPNAPPPLPSTATPVVVAPPAPASEAQAATAGTLRRWSNRLTLIAAGAVAIAAIIVVTVLVRAGGSSGDGGLTVDSTGGPVIVQQSSQMDSGQRPVTSVAPLTVSAPSPTLRVGEGVQLLLDPLTDTSRVSWTSQSPAIASVNSSGRVTARRTGRVTITAQVDTQKAIIELTVEPRSVVAAARDTPTTVAQPPIAEVDAIGNIRGPIRLKVGDSAAYSAVAQLSDGSTTSDRPFRWSSSDDRVLSIDAATGRAHASGAGEVSVTVHLEGIVKALGISIAEAVAKRDIVTPPPPADPAASVPAAVDACYARVLDQTALEQLATMGTASERSAAADLATLIRRSSQVRVTKSDPGNLTLQGNRGSVDFSVNVTYRSRFGPTARDIFVVRSLMELRGSTWQVSTCRVINHRPG